MLRRKSIRNSRSEFLQPILMVESAENGSASNRMALRNTMAMMRSPARADVAPQGFPAQDSCAAARD